MEKHRQNEVPIGWENTSTVLIVLCCVALIAGFFFQTSGVTSYDILPFLLLLACPVMHLLMHRGHHGHR